MESLAKQSLIFLIISFLAPSALKAETLNFRHLNEKQGLNYTWIWDIYKDSQGYMWMSSQFGAFRYNGYEFKEYKFQDERTQTLLSVNFVYESSDRMIWFGTNKGLYKHNPVNNTYCTYTSDIFNPYHISGNHVTDMVEDIYGNLWIASNAGLDTLMPDGGVRFTETPSRITSILYDTRNRVIVGTDSGNLLLYDDISHKLNDFIPGIKLNASIHDILEDKNKNIWCSTTGDGLYCYDPRTKALSRFSKMNASLPNDLVRKIASDSEGTIWVCTEQGLVKITSDGDSEFINNKSGNLWNLNDNATYSIFCDEDDNLWVGTFFGGVNVAFRKNNLFNYYLASSEEYTSESKVISCIVKSNQRLLIGTENDGFYVLDNDGNVISHVEKQLSSNNVHTLLIDSKDNLWVGTYYGGLFLKRKGCATYESFNTSTPWKGKMTSDNIYCIFEDSQNNLWIGTQYAGIYQYRYKDNKMHKVDLPGFDYAFVWSIIEDSFGNLWVASYGDGLYRLNPEHRYKPEKCDTDARYIISIEELEDGRIVAGTEKEGIIVVNPMTMETKRFMTEHGLCDNTIYGVLQDKQGHIWFSTTSGLGMTDTEFRSFINYTIKDGLPTNRFNYNACRRIDDKLFFGSINGLVIVNPNQRLHLVEKSNVLFQNFYLNNKRIEPLSGTFLNKELNSITELELNYNQNSFGLDFTTNIYGFNYNQNFAYKVVGLDNTWHYLGTKNRIDFTNLEPKRYEIHVASYIDGEISSTSSVLSVRIRPVWWQGTLAKVSFMTLSFLIIGYLVYLYIKTSRHKYELEMEHLAREKDKEINEMKFRFFVNISHEFKTPLSLILGPVEQLNEGNVAKDKFDRYFNIIKRNADKLLGLINELLAFREVQFARLHLSKNNLSTLFSGIIYRYEQMLEEKKICLKTDVAHNITMEADFNKVEKIFDNLISNAYKHTEPGGELLISATQTKEKQVKIIVRNTGKGIPEDKLEHIFDRFFTGESYDRYSSGLGLSYVKSLVELHSGDITAESVPDSSTTITVLLPLRQSKTHEGSENIEPYNVDRKINLPSDIHEEYMDNDLYDKLSHGTRILIVEDDNTMRELLSDYFSDKFNVFVAESGEVAATIIKNHLIEIVVSDVMLSGGMNGFELCHYIKSQIDYCHIKVILMTVLSEGDYKYQGYEVGADSYIIKPFPFSLLELRLRNFIISSYNTREKNKIQVDLSKITVDSSNPDEVLLKKISDVVFEHIAESEFGVDDLCWNIGMSKATLYRKIKSITGESANKFIQSTRLKYSARMLQETDKTISSIAYDVGFSDPYYYSRAFKKLFGVSPKQWRARHIEGLSK